MANIKVAPGIKFYKHQIEGIEWLRQRFAKKANALLADDMGLGKTAQCLCAAPEHAPILVICPAIAKNVWKAETKKFTPWRKSTFLDGRRNFRWPQPGEVLAMNFDILPECPIPKGETYAKLPAELVKTLPPNLILIVDEAQRVKNAKAKRTQAVRCIGYEARQKGGQVIVNTGTPFLNRPQEVWAILVLGNLQFEAFGDLGKNRFDCAMTMAGGYKEQVNRAGLKVWKFDPSLVIPEFAQRLGRVSLRRTKDEVLDLPPKRFNTLTVDVDPGDVKDVDEALDILLAKGVDIDAIDLKALQKEMGFERISKARAALAKAKTNAALELAEDCEDQGELPIFFSAHLSPVEALAKRPGWAKITGSESTAQRAQIEADFQAGKLSGIACTIRSTGVALTLTRATRVVFVDQDWTPANNAQATDRAYRIGQNRSILVTTIVANHPLDERLAALLAFKEVMIEKIVEKAREYQNDPMNVGPTPSVKTKQRSDFLEKKVAETKEFGKQLPAPIVLPPLSRPAKPLPKMPEGMSPGSVEGIRFLLKNSDAAVERALVVLYDNQTLDEKQAGTTKHNNGIGFNGVDAAFGTSLAQQVKSGRHLSQKQLTHARKMLPKYAGQLAAAAAEKGSKK